MAANTQPNKDTIYIDVDDEITGIIDKVRSSDGRIVALVLPKRATVLQSIVNMRLLKRSAEQAKKQLVLITTEAGLLPLAGTVGIHVADTLQSKPEIPQAPSAASAAQPVEESLSLEDEPEEEFTAENAGNKPVGELAKKAGKGGLVITSGVETESPVDTAPTTPSTTGKATKKDKALKVPSFDKFRVRLLLAILAVIGLAVLIYLALFVLPKATVNIATDTQDINSNIGFSLDTAASSLDLATANVPATAAQQQKTYTQQVDTTGEVNNGKQAKGNVTFTLTNCSHSSVDIPQGTGITANGLTYVTQSEVTLSSVQIGPNCNPGGWEAYYSKTIPVVALKGGADYNTESGTKFSLPSSISGASSVDASANGKIDGGTDDITQVVAQKDIENAKKQIDTKDPAIENTLYQQLVQNGLFPIKSTYQASDPNVSSDKQPGDKATTVTVTISITYTMFGTNKANLLALVKDDVGQQADLDKQAILDDGLSKATFTIDDLSDTKARISLENTATLGPKIDTVALKSQIAGKKSGDAKEVINQLPGVTDVDIKLSPFWVSSIPKNTDKIVVQVGKAAANN